MSTKKVSYIQLLKEAINEYDAKVMDYKGPITEPILTFDGNGELSTHKDASSILERYYFKENENALVETEDVGPDKEVPAEADEDAEDPNEIVTGEEADGVKETMDDLEDEILDEDLELEDYEPGSEKIAAKDEPLEAEKASPTAEMVSLENVIIEKLIKEMEEEDKDPGTEEAGTKKSEKEVEDVVEDFDLLEDEDLDEKPEEKGEEKDLDVDKKVANEGEGMGPIRVKAARELEEAFKIFKEQVEEEEKKEDEKEDKKDEDDLKEEMALFEDDEIEGDEEKKEDEKEEK
jgi:hypothetical protein